LTQRCGEYMDPETCIDCGACEPVCPVEAIFTEEDVPESETAFTELNVQWFSDKGAVRAKVNEMAPSGLHFPDARLAQGWRKRSVNSIDHVASGNECASSSALRVIFLSRSSSTNTTGAAPRG
jgi:ferredoxin